MLLLAFQTFQDDPHPKPLLFTYNGKLYDIRKFASKHPGGRKVLEKTAGTDLKDLMNGETRVLGVRHDHSKAAYDILERYAVDHKIKVRIYIVIVLFLGFKNERFL